MTSLCVVYGAGGHGKVIAEILAACGQKVECFIDDKVSGTEVISLPVYPAAEWLFSHPDGRVALGIGDNVARERAAVRAQQAGCAILTVVHPAAVIARSARIKEGAAIMPGAVLNPDCEIGEGAIINTGAIVEHDVRIGRFAHLSPKSAAGGGAQIGAYAHIGMGASVLPLKRIGARCIIGGGSVVISDIPEHQTAYGIPAKVHSS